MRAMRQDAWTTEDDRVLADILIRHIRQGSTQLAAFDEAASILGRTAAACGYRWNAVVRSEYKQEISTAKTERKAAVV
ncbi:MAG: transcription factor, RsfA family, partial [Bacilli bacterium]|nr:transcription factor, RsfA family [Bacilli bacterium]